jgi:hypothetical protein
LALEPIEWLEPVATVGGRLNDCEKLLKDLSRGAVVLCAVFSQPQFLTKIGDGSDFFPGHRIGGNMMINDDET